MKSFVYLSPDVTQKMEEIKRGVYLKMNGVTADRMREAGVVYASNYGVSLPELRQMSREITPSEPLADALWIEKIRETMLLAIWIHPSDCFNEIKAERWIADVNTLELSENLSRNLLFCQTYAGQKSLEWVVNESPWVCSVGYFTAAFGIKALSSEQKKQLVHLIIDHNCINEVSVYRAVALFVRKCASESREFAKFVLQELSAFSSSEVVGKRIVYEELITEMEYGS